MYLPAHDIGPGWLRSTVNGTLAIDINYARKVGAEALEGLSAAGLSGQTDGGQAGPQGGSLHDPEGNDSDMMPNKAKKTKTESSTWLSGGPVDTTHTGKISITVMDDTNLKVMSPGIILERVQAYIFFEQFQMLLPKTNMLNARVMEQVSSWWRNYAMPGDMLDIDITTGLAMVSNVKNPFNSYALGSFGSIPE